jgi:hypothetical protein
MFDEQEDLNEIDPFDLAVYAGLTRRLGPSNAEIETWPGWKKAVLRLTPVKHRWRFSAHADLIRDFETRG